MFSKGDKPVLCVLIYEDNVKDCIKSIKKAKKVGAEMVGIAIETLALSDRTDENFKKIIDEAKPLTTYITDYSRFDKWGKFGAEEKEKELLHLAGLGGDLIDMPGNFYDDCEYEMSYKDDVVNRQKEFIKKVHDMGKKVLISTHVLQFADEEEVLKVLLSQQERGADVAKIVTASNDKRQLAYNLALTQKIYEKLSIPFVFVSSGAEGRLHRLAGPHLGSCLWFAALKRGKYDVASQPLYSDVKRYNEVISSNK